MNASSLGRIVFILGMTAAVGGPVGAQGKSQGGQEQKEQKKKDREERAQQQQENQKAKQAERQAARAQAAEQQRANQQGRQAERAQAGQQQQENQKARQADRAQRVQQQEASQQAQQAERRHQRAEMEAQRQQTVQGRNERLRQQQAAQREQAVQQQQVQQQQAQQLSQQRMANRAARLSTARQNQLIKEQQLRNQQYKTVLQRQELEAQQRAVSLQQARRLAQYRYQQRYLNRLREQRLALGNAYDYNNDPYYYTAPSYRYQRAGRSYDTNEYGANLLKQAVNLGYEEGVRAAQADGEDGFRGDYRSSYAYQDANYGYTGMYVQQSDYNYYFREGFRRGYEDGSSNSYRYGSNANGTLGILSTVLSAILNLQQLR
jgi:hypothetical protein